MRELLSSFLDMWREDHRFKTILSATASWLINIAFTIFNGVLGILYRSVWNGSICVYYFLLAFIRGIIVQSQRDERDKHPDKGAEKRKKIFFNTHLILLFMDIALIAPIAYMVLGKRLYKFGLIPAIAMAAYTCYRLIMSIIHLMESEKTGNILIKELQTINLLDSLVAVLTLQNALIVAAGGSTDSMMALTAWTSAGIWLSIVFITLRSLIS